MANILTNIGYVGMERIEAMLATPVISKSLIYNTTVSHALTDANNGKTFSIANFRTSCTIKEIRVRSNFIAGQQTWRVAFVNNANGITPADTSINCLTAEIFQVGDYINIEDEIAYVSSVDIINNIITVTRGVKGTVASYHNIGARMETLNDGIRLVLFKNSSRKLVDRIKLLKYLMTWKGTTNAAITANDKVIKCTNSPLNMDKYDTIYINDGTNYERASVEQTNGVVTNVTYNNMIYVADPLLAHATGVEVQKQNIYDMTVMFSGGDGNIYGVTFVDEKLDGTLYPSGVNITVDIVVDIFSTK